jgi:hypothetical protein
VALSVTEVVTLKTLDCALMETVFHDVPFAAGPKNWSKATHVAGKVYSQLTLSRNLALIDLSAVPLRKLGISRKDLIESEGSNYPEPRSTMLSRRKGAFLCGDPMPRFCHHSSQRRIGRDLVSGTAGEVCLPSFASSSTPTTRPSSV